MSDRGKKSGDAGGCNPVSQRNFKRFSVITSGALQPQIRSVNLLYFTHSFSTSLLCLSKLSSNTTTPHPPSDASPLSGREVVSLGWGPAGLEGSLSSQG